MPYTKSDLIALVVQQLHPDLNDPVPPEVVVIIACVEALPVGEYCCYDPEQGVSPPSAVHGLAGNTVASWSGQLPNSLGYGEVAQLPTCRGTGLCFSVGGSPLSSAISVWFMPAEWEGWVA